jgi:hypothetical protein
MSNRLPAMKITSEILRRIIKTSFMDYSPSWLLWSTSLGLKSDHSAQPRKDSRFVCHTGIDYLQVCPEEEPWCHGEIVKELPALFVS